MTSQQQTRRKPRKNYNRNVKIVRRIHMYTGLVLLPWVIFFGFSGMLFNHPHWFGPVEVVSKKGAGEMNRALGFKKPSADSIADAVVKQLNGSADLSAGRWERDGGAIIEGTLGYSGTSDKGRTLVQISPNGGNADVRYFIDSKKQEQPDFHGKKLPEPAFDIERNRQVATKLAESAGLTLLGELEPSQRGGAEVRFQVKSPEDDRLWNVTYSLAGNALNARAADASSGMDLYSIASRLHKTHHYPDRKGARWVWTFLADATGITMVFWGISGLIMWWQIKPTRVLGMGGLGIAAVLAALIFTGTFQSMTFGPARSQNGGGKGGKGNAPAQSRPAESRPDKVKAPKRPGPPSVSINTGPVKEGPQAAL